MEKTGAIIFTCNYAKEVDQGDLLLTITPINAYIFQEFDLRKILKDDSTIFPTKHSTMLSMDKANILTITEYVPKTVVHYEQDSKLRSICSPTIIAHKLINMFEQFYDSKASVRSFDSSSIGLRPGKNELYVVMLNMGVMKMLYSSILDSNQLHEKKGLEGYFNDEGLGIDVRSKKPIEEKLQAKFQLLLTMTNSGLTDEQQNDAVINYNTSYIYF